MHRFRLWALLMVPLLLPACSQMNAGGAGEVAEAVTTTASVTATETQPPTITVTPSDTPTATMTGTATPTRTPRPTITPFLTVTPKRTSLPTNTPDPNRMSDGDFAYIALQEADVANDETIFVYADDVSGMMFCERLPTVWIAWTGTCEDSIDGMRLYHTQFHSLFPFGLLESTVIDFPDVASAQEFTDIFCVIVYADMEDGIETQYAEQTESCAGPVYEADAYANYIAMRQGEIVVVLGHSLFGDFGFFEVLEPYASIVEARLIETASKD